MTYGKCQCRGRQRWVALLLTALGACRVAAPPAIEPPRTLSEVERATPAPVPTIADEFIITFWCGPPLAAFDDTRAAEIAAAGFNLVGSPCEGDLTPLLNLRVLDTAHRHGLRVLVSDPRLHASRPLQEGWQERADRALATYRDHPALAGYFIVDEPGSAAIYPDIAALRRRIERTTPGRIGYVNLLPDYVFPGPDDYREYVEGYLFHTRPKLLSYDHYPFLVDGDRPSFFDNLTVVRDLAAEYGVPFLLVVQLMPHAEYRDVTYAELAWQVYHALAFGARGISYFAYWTPTAVPDNLAYRFRKGVIEGGRKTEHYDNVSRLNREVRAATDALTGYSPAGVWDSAGSLERSTVLPPPFDITSGDVIVGLFKNATGDIAMLAVNRSYLLPARLTLGGANHSLDLLSPATDSWSPAPTELEIAPGEGRLLRTSRHRD